MNVLPQYTKDPLKFIVGESPVIQYVKSLIRQVAPTDVTVLITGESGTGKELVAKGIHALSNRASGPLMTLNCGAIPEGIFESEIFGHEKGSFTSADQRRKGYFEMADGGTLFLDEIGEMPLSVQVKILRVLETGTFLRVGGSKELSVNVRIIAATNRDLSVEALKGRFRQDLFYRLKAISINLPSLRERPEDIPMLVNYFGREFALRNGREAPHFSSEAIDLISGTPWRGNVRELKNFIESLIALTHEQSIESEHVRLRLGQEKITYNLPVPISDNASDQHSELTYRTLLEIKRDISLLKGMVQKLTEFAARNTGSQFSASVEDVPYLPIEPEQRRARVDKNEIMSNFSENHQPSSLEEMEKEQIKRILQEYNGNRRATAEALGIGERTLYRKIRQYKIK